MDRTPSCHQSIVRINPVVNPPQFATHWAELLHGSISSLRRLKGGINNQVYRCGEKNKYWVIKGYPKPRKNKLDRMTAEIDFLKYAKNVAPEYVPKIYHIDTKRRCIILEHIEGEVFAEGITPPQSAINEAVRFFSELNNNQLAAKALIKLDAAEGEHAIEGHIKNVWSRIEQMNTEGLMQKDKQKAKGIIQALRREITREEEKISRLIDANIIKNSADLAHRCVSPSDFGFHNAIKTSKSIKFIDFEFAGWDDGAKTIADFILQPRVPVYQVKSPLIVGFAEPLRKEIEIRAKALIPILGLKWICIILGILNPERHAAIKSVTSDESNSKLVSRQLSKALTYTERLQKQHMIFSESLEDFRS